jgi:multidrug efflux pump subunit AcrB
MTEATKFSWADVLSTRPVVAWIVSLACIFGGIWGFDNIPQLEDPKFPLRYAYVITHFPGASARDVDLLVTDRMEQALQRLPQLQDIESRSSDGRSEVRIEIADYYEDSQLPQIWDELRRRVADAAQVLPQGASTPFVQDDFNDVYGEIYAVFADEFSAGERRDMAKRLGITLNAIEGVAKVQFRGLREEHIYIEIEQNKLQSLGLPLNGLLQTLRNELQIQNAGSIDAGIQRLRIAPLHAYSDLDALKRMTIGRPGSAQMVQLSDIAKVERRVSDNPSEIVRRNGREAFLVAVAAKDGANVVTVGEAIGAEMQRQAEQLPLGVSVEAVYQQHRIVDAAVSTFMQNLLLSIATVVAALCLFMGWRAGLVVGTVLLLTLLSTLWVMAMAGIELQRISLGAMIIAMGMLVDNAIVVAEGMVVGVAAGQSAMTAARHIIKRTQLTLLGATIIGIMAFAPIGLSNDSSGHFLRSLFYVIAISLLLSWLLAVTLAPFFGNYLLKNNGEAKTDRTRFPLYEGLLRNALRHPWLSTGLIVVVTVISVWSMKFVKQSFFPNTNTPFYFVDVKLPQGTSTLETDRYSQAISALLLKEPANKSITAHSGNGTIRFAATVVPDQPNPSAANFMVEVDSLDAVGPEMSKARSNIEAQFPEAEILTTRQVFSPTGKMKFEAHISGPDEHVLRELAEDMQKVMREHGLIDIRSDWHDRSLQLVPQINEQRLRLAGLTRSEVYQALQFHSDGQAVATFIDGDKTIPVLIRAAEQERGDPEALLQRSLWSSSESTFVPLSEIIERFEPYAINSILYRQDRLLTITVQANEPRGANFNEEFLALRPKIEAIKLPHGYELEWGGEYESSLRAKSRLRDRIPPAFGIMLLLSVIMYARLRQPAVIWITVPMMAAGVVLALLIGNMPLTFVAFLGILSLAGMLIKNSMVLVDAIDQRVEEQGLNEEALCAACASRFRPVLLASGTTIAGMVPLLSDSFFREMAVSIMGGLAFGTILTLLAIPVFYRLLFSKRYG